MVDTNISEFLNEQDCESYEYLGDVKFNKYLSGYTKTIGSKRFEHKEEAYKEMLRVSEASGIVKSKHGFWTVRKGKILKVPHIKYRPEIACLRK